MKKITVILLLSIYSVSTLGLSLKSFYCCGNLKTVTVSFSQDEQQEFAKDNGIRDCCKTKYQFFKVKDNHVAGDVINIPALYFSYSHLFTPSLPVINNPSEQINIANKSNAPPLIPGVTSYIFNCVFRI